MPITPHQVAAALPFVATTPLLAAAGTTLYIATALACIAAAIRRPRDKTLWLALTAVHTVMAIDAATGLRLFLADAGRSYFRGHQWYSERREPQILLSLLIVLAMATLAAIALWRTRGPDRTSRGKQLALAGTALSALILALSLISLHQIDTALQWPTPYANLGIALRVTGCLLTTAGAGIAITAPVAPQTSQ